MSSEDHLSFSYRMPFSPVKGCQMCFSLRSDCCTYTSHPNFRQFQAALVINGFENTLSLSYNRTSGHGSRAHTERSKGSRLCSLHLLGLQLYSPSAWWTQMRSHASSAAASFPIQIEIQAEHDLALETDGEPHDVR